MLRCYRALFIALLLCAATIGGISNAQAAIKVVTTLPHLKYLAESIGGGLVQAQSLASGMQDPHYISPKPTMMKAAREASALIEIGLHLDVWAEQVASGSGNPRIQRGQPGRIIASRGVRLLELPAEVSRAWGDIHPYGNPHIWLDPLNLKQECRNVAEGLAAISPANAKTFRDNVAALNRRIDNALFGETLVNLVGGDKLARLAYDRQLYDFLKSNSYQGKPLMSYLGGWLKQAQPIRGRKVVTYHKTWIYFADRFGLWLRGEIEEKPGIPPGPQHQIELIQRMRAEGIKTILMSNFYDPALANYIASKTGAKVLRVPIEVGGESGVNTYFDLISRILGRLTSG